MADTAKCPGCGGEFDSDYAMWEHTHACKAMADKLSAAWETARATKRILSIQETVEFLDKKPYRGVPERLRRGKRGPQTRRTQYDVAAHARNAIAVNLLWRLTKLPKAQLKGGRTRGHQQTDARLKEEAVVLKSANKFLPYRKYVTGKARDFDDLVRMVDRHTNFRFTRRLRRILAPFKPSN